MPERHAPIDLRQLLMLKLALDINTGNLVNYRNSTVPLPNLRQGILEVQLRFCQKEPFDSSSEYEPAELTDYLGPRLGLFNASTFTLNDSETAALALTPHDSFTLNSDDADDPYYEGEFNLSTQEIADLGDEKSAACYLTIGLVRTADLSLVPIFDHVGGTNCTLFSATDDGFGSLPVPAAGGPRVILLPITVKDAATGEEYTLTRTAPGVVEWVWSNP